MTNNQDHISVCICTYRREQLLHKLLVKLQDQITSEHFTFSVVVVDNDSSRSAKKNVDLLKKTSKISIAYEHEPVQNIALSRNKAINCASGNFIAFLDDDELPDNTWLYNLYRAMKQYNAAGILGPVEPHFEAEPPQWIVKGQICKRTDFKSGTIISNPKYTRTGNVLFDKSIFLNGTVMFDSRFGRTGGEDADLFERMLNKGHLFVWCNEAIVYENVPPERMTRSYHLRRALLRGELNSRHAPLISLYALKSLVAILLYTSVLPILLIAGQHWFMKFLIKDCDHAGKLLALFGIRIVKERSF